ncbi:PQQ-dependent sugar dehydrogenase [Rhizobium leguminosarum]|uniref:PQQ-dependent sugar dehydrogenase n=1 Tax=Rhizobium leguminosarum TaxID=384 RepID=UPI001C90E070|nr:sorbosone dehydrogenase family protein [Rhizobium leguminosarum]MBY2919425.1 sorbosone dehydrogenase family protein [Rhizobium leguminosarum]MBY2926725.1 sorbosone dehydrogenase family protein [Rhizobium leguminosarum]MBY2937119.1 sorbosone dehydrogenase family protein [Rhizobium leguminosarum]MBY2975360.1 sorbosone dehydrogenase family protein [Rhizobium leguminosarum]MBY2982762.1 sorbosone dehydrogenase family protein [Rhizobium leguminosarum]
MKKSQILGASVLSISVGVGLAAYAQSGGFDISQQIGPNPVLPDPAPSLLPDLKVAEVVGWKDGETPAAPNGLTVTAYAKDLANPRTVHTLPNGDVLVVQARGPSGEPASRPKDLIRGWIMSIAHGDGGEQKESNVITLLRDANRDGKVDERHDLLKKLDSPFGVAWVDNTLYVASTSAILAYHYELGQNEITAQPKTITPLPGGPINHHWTKDLALSPDGQMLYVSVGSNSNIVENGLEAEKGRAAIWQVDRHTGAARVFASGLRNPNGLTFNPETGSLWTVVNERDELGPNLVPDYMTSVKEGGFYGWPWSYYGNHVDARVHPPRPDMVERATPPDYALSSHVAALGLAFSMNSALPAAYANGAFIGEHGSWNRDSFNGYKVVYVPFEAGKPSGKAQDVVTGFIKDDQAKGRPVGVGIDGTGALLVADDAGNTVWRVASSDGKITPQPIGTDQVSVNRQVSTDATAGGTTDMNPGIGTERTGSTPQSQMPAAPADERPTDQKPLPGQPDKSQPAQMQIAPAGGP